MPPGPGQWVGVDPGQWVGVDPGQGGGVPPRQDGVSLQWTRRGHRPPGQGAPPPPGQATARRYASCGHAGLLCFDYV